MPKLEFKFNLGTDQEAKVEATKQSGEIKNYLMNLDFDIKNSLLNPEKQSVTILGIMAEINSFLSKHGYDPKEFIYLNYKLEDNILKIYYRIDHVIEELEHYTV